MAAGEPGTERRIEIVFAGISRHHLASLIGLVGPFRPYRSSSLPTNA